MTSMASGVPIERTVQTCITCGMRFRCRHRVPALSCCLCISLRVHVPYIRTLGPKYIIIRTIIIIIIRRYMDP